MIGLIGLKKRRKSVASTIKITNAVNNIASTNLYKLKKLFFIINQNKSFIDESLRPYLLFNEKQHYIFIFGTDRGLCGNYNQLLFNKLFLFIKNTHHKSNKIFVFGKKLFTLVQNANIDAVCVDYQKNINDTIASIFGYLTTQPRITIIYKKFFNVLTQDLDILSYDNEAKVRKDREDDGNAFVEYDYNNIYSLYFTILFNYIIIHSFMSEETARMILMDNATKNAKELLVSLEMKVNTIRKTKITNQLIEIISGIESLKKDDD